MLRHVALLAVLGLAACSGEPTPPPAAPETPPAPATPETPPLKAEDLAGSASNTALVPSIVETQKALEQAGISSNLSDLVTERNFDMAVKDPDRVAVRTGVVLADLLLTVKGAPKDASSAKFEKINAGMQELGGGADIQSTISDLRERLNTDQVTPADLLKELDELAGAIIPELNFNGQDRIVPLIQAGSWLEGANLVAKAVKASGNAGAADALLKQPAVVKYFHKYVKEQPAGKTPEAVTQKLDAALTTLDGLANKAEPLTMADIETVITTTDEVLALL